MARSATATAAAPLLLDGVLPEFRFARLETLAVAADPGRVYAAARELDLFGVHSPLFDLLVRARGMAARVRRRTPPPQPSVRVAELFDAEGEWGHPWLGLGETPGRELVVGAVGKIWKPTIEWLAVPAEQFPSFAEPGWVKIAAGFVVHPYGMRRCLLSCEARIACTDTDTAARLARHRGLVSNGAGLVLRKTLRAVRASVRTAAGWGPVPVRLISESRPVGGASRAKARREPSAVPLRAEDRPGRRSRATAPGMQPGTGASAPGEKRPDRP